MQAHSARVARARKRGAAVSLAIGRCSAILLCLAATLPAPTWGGAPGKPPDDAAVTPTAGTVDPDDLNEELTQPVRGRKHLGLVLWLPREWAMAHGSGREIADLLSRYTVVAVVVGQIGALGPTFASAADIRGKVVLRKGKVDYAPVEKVSSEADFLASVLRAMFAKILGRMGEGFEILFFPGVDGGELLADARRPGTFSVVIRDLAGQPESLYTYHLPLSSLLPPKLCPVGKERVKASWKYCPWHGIPLQTEVPKP